MADPLALLGDAFANFGANYAQRHFQNEREDKLRRQQLDDRAQARQFQLDDRQHAETRDDTIYSQRKYDSIKAQLIKDGVLDPKNDSLEAMAAALRSRGPNYEQSVVELANMKAHAREIIDRSKGDPAGLGRIATMDVSQIDDARALYSRALSSMGFKLSSDEDRIRTNQEAGGEALSNANAAMVAANQRIAQLNNEYERVTGGQLTDEEVAKIKQQARSAPELASLKETDLLKPSNKALVEAAITKAEQNFRAMRAFQIQGEAKNASTQQRNAAVQLEAITAAAKSGLPIKFNSAAVTGDTAVASAEAPKTATAQDGASFVASLKGGGRSAPAEAQAASSAALGDGAAPALSIKGLAQRIPDPMTVLAAPGTILDNIGRYGGALVGGLYDGNYSVPKKGLVTMAGEAIGNAMAGDIYAKETESPEERAINDEILLKAPNSLRALEIRRKRGMPPMAPDAAVTPPALR